MGIFLVPEDLWNLVTGNEINVKGAKVKSKVCLMMDETMYPMIRSSKTAKEVWVKLQHRYEDKGLM
jgi:hypothetical protein